MRRVGRYQSLAEAEERAAFLRAHGIAAHVTDTSSLLRAAGPRSGRSRAALWVVLEPQYQDAVALLENPDHEVTHSLDERQLEQLETQGAAQAQQTLFRGVLLIGAGLIAILALLYWRGMI